MATSPSFDKRPVYLNKLGQPLRPGSQLRYYLVGTNTPKTVYVDTAGTVAASWPQIINSESRTDQQIFVKSGDATVVSWEILEGVDPLTATFPDDYSYDNEWIDQDLAASTILAGSAVFDVDTIATLRTLNPNTLGYTEFDVAGYYAAGDAPARRYHWNPATVTADNGGTVIRNPSIGTGAFELRIEGPLVDSRVFGIIPWKSDLSVNGLLSAMVAALGGNQRTPYGVYFAPGVYRVDPGTFDFTCHVVMDRNTQWNVASSGTFTMVFSQTWDLRQQDYIEYNASTGSVALQFTGKVPQDVKLVWWSGAHSDYLAGVGNALRAAAATTDAQHTIIIDRPHLIDGSLGGSFTVFNPVKFVGTGKIKNGQLAYTVYLNGPLTNRTDTTAGTRKAILDASGSSFFRFPQDAKILASWFGNDGSEDCGPALNLISLTSSIGTQFVLDADTYLQNDGAAYGYTAFANLVLVPAGGRLHVPGSTAVIHIPSVTYTEECIFVADPGAIAVDSGAISPMMWYDSTNPDPAIRAALFSMLHGGRDTVCNLAGRSWTASATVTSTSNFNTRRKICNGTLSSSIVDPLIFMSSGSTFRLHTEDVITTLVGPFVSTQAGVTIVNMSSTRSFISCSASGGSAYSISGAVYNMDHSNSSFSAFSAITGTLATLRMSNCYVSGSMAVTASSIEIIGGEAQNYQNANTTWHLRAPQCTVHGVNSEGVNFNCLPSVVNATPIIAHSVIGNTFKWLNATYGTAYVLATADAANTRLNGFSVVGNSWFSENIATAGSTPVVAAVTSGGGTYFADRSAHKCKVASNAGVETGILGGNSSLIIPSTVLTGSFTWSSVINTSTSPDFVEIALPPAAFGIPGVPTYAIGTASGKVVDPAGSVNTHVTYKGYGVDALNAGGAGILRFYADRALGNPSTTPEDTIYYSATLFGFGG